MKKYVCIHGHFYQPPRENPWLEEVELQDSAYPYHDWNERITAECYEPNTASRILDHDLRIIDIVNNYSRISFNFGPTLLNWLERSSPDVYRAVIEADRISRERFSGHGSAMAQVYNHMIMPLASRRDMYTQALWGIRDFKKRFGRDPEGMWLPETAVSTDTLEVLAELGILFTILSPSQAKRIKKMGKGHRWHDVEEKALDTTVPYLCPLPSGRTITIFFYNGGVSREVAFGGLLTNGENFARRLVGVLHGDGLARLVHIATDGETYGHHHRYGDMALAYCLYYIESMELAAITNYGEFLASHPPEHMVEIRENTSWSCVHGIERWRSDCGCNSGRHPEWHQAWRGPLREAVDWLGERLKEVYEEEGPKTLRDIYEARNDYIDVILDRSRENVENFLASHSPRELSQEEKVRTLKLLEMQRNGMLSYTSCGWFFDDISGIETVQIMRYAARAMQLALEVSGQDLEPRFLEMLEKAPGNVFENGKKAYETSIPPSKVDLKRVGAHYAMSSLFESYSESTDIHCYRAESELRENFTSGRLRLSMGVVRISSRITREEERLSFAVLHLGDQNINGGVRAFDTMENHEEMAGAVKSAFDKGDVPEIIRLLDRYFDGRTFSVWHLFKDEQRRILDELLRLTYESIDASYRSIYENNYTIMNFFRWLQIPVPRALLIAAEHIINMDLMRVFKDHVDIERLEALIREAEKWSVELDSDTIGFVVSRWVNSAMEGLKEGPEDTAVFEKITEILRILKPLSIKLNLWKAQNVYFSLGKSLYAAMRKRADEGDEPARRWVDVFTKLGYYMDVKVAV